MDHFYLQKVRKWTTFTSGNRGKGPLLPPEIEEKDHFYLQKCGKRHFYLQKCGKRHFYLPDLPPGYGYGSPAPRLWVPVPRLWIPPPHGYGYLPLLYPATACYSQYACTPLSHHNPSVGGIDIYWFTDLPFYQIYRFTRFTSGFNRGNRPHLPPG